PALRSLTPAAVPRVRSRSCDVPQTLDERRVAVAFMRPAGLMPVRTLATELMAGEIIVHVCGTQCGVPIAVPDLFDRRRPIIRECRSVRPIGRTEREHP